MREGHIGKRGGHREHGEHRDRGFMKHGMTEPMDQHPKSAQTFRRGRAIAFLDKLMVNRATLQRQLNQPELESIKQVVSGELKATEAIIEEFKQIFQIHEIAPEDTTSNVKKEESKEKDENN